MKHILKLSAVFATVLLAACMGVSCSQKEKIDTDQYTGPISLSAVAPNPVMRGGTLTILGANLENVKEVRLAGGVVITNFESVEPGPHGKLLVRIPVEGPEVGKVSIVGNDGTIRTSFSDLTFTEPIEVDAISPTEALSGDVITITGEYLNVVQEVIFGGEVFVTEFLSQSRHELQVAVPSNALTGYVIVGDVNQVVDSETIPNLIYSPEVLTIGEPTVDEAADAVYRLGDEIVVTGEHLDMIQSVSLPGAAGVDFTVSDDGTSITFVLPDTATDGNIQLTSYAGTVFVAGNIETVSVENLVAHSESADGRFKAGCTVSLTGDNLDLVTGVRFTGADGSFYYDEGVIYTTLPSTATDGGVGVVLGNGKEVWSDPIELVKPIVTEAAPKEPNPTNTVTAGTDVVVVEGTDLDLVSTVVMGDKAQSFIDCDFVLVDDNIEITVPAAAYTGVFTLSAENGDQTTTQEFEVVYDMPISLEYSAPSFALGKDIEFTGAGFNKIESIYLKGIKIVDFTLKSDDAVAFPIPEGIGPGVYRLDFQLLDGTSMTWPKPFEITASYTETFVWQGEQDLGSWSGNFILGEDGAFADAGIMVGDVIRIYYDTYADWWQFNIFDGHWNGLNLPEVGGNNVNTNNAESGAGVFFSFEVTPDNIGNFDKAEGWGGAMILQGESAIIKGISLIHYGATETVVWEGSERLENYDRNLELGSENAWVENGLMVGQTIRIYFTPDDPAEWSIQLFDGHWNGMFPGFAGAQFNQDNNPEAAADGYISFEVTDEIFAKLTDIQGWGSALIVQGKFMVVTKIAFI